MKKLILTILLFTVYYLQSQTITSNDFIINSNSTEATSVDVSIPYSSVTNALAGWGSSPDDIFRYLEVKVIVSGGGEDIYYIDGGFEGDYKIYYHNDYLYTGGYYERPYLYFVAPIDGGTGEYPTKVTAKIDYVVVHFTVDSLNQSTLLSSNSPYDETTFIYWNKITNHNISLSSTKEGNITKATSSFDPSNSEVPMVSKWVVEISHPDKATITHNYNSGDKNFIDNLMIPSEYGGGKIKITNKVEFLYDTNRYKEFSNEFVIKPWYEGMSFELESNNMQICFGDQSKFNLNYTEEEIPNYVDYSWHISDKLQIISSTKTSITVKANSTSNGIANVTLSLEGVPEIYSDDIWIGKPNFTLTPIEYVMQTLEPGVTFINYYGSTNYLDQGVNRVDWSFPGPIKMINGDLTKAYFTTDTRGGMGYIYANAYNSCGSSENRTFFEVVDEFIMYGPNPADEQLVISTLDSDSELLQTKSISEKNLKSDDEIATIILYDKSGSVIFYDKLISNKNVVWDTRSLKNGTYHLHIVDKNKSIQKQIIIEHK